MRVRIPRGPHRPNRLMAGRRGRKAFPGGDPCSGALSLLPCTLAFEPTARGYLSSHFWRARVRIPPARSGSKPAGAVGEWPKPKAPELTLARTPLLCDRRPARSSRCVTVIPLEDGVSGSNPDSPTKGFGPRRVAQPGRARKTRHAPLARTCAVVSGSVGLSRCGGVIQPAKLVPRGPFPVAPLAQASTSAEARASIAAGVSSPPPFGSPLLVLDHYLRCRGFEAPLLPGSQEVRRSAVTGEIAGSIPASAAAQG